MTTELWMLIATCGLALSLTIPLFRAMRVEWGLKAMIGNREGLQPLTGWGGRLVRAHHNLMENLTIFAIVVLVVHVSGATNDLTGFGAQLFFYSRLAHVIVYTIGLSFVRTIAYVGGAMGIIVMAIQLF